MGMQQPNMMGMQGMQQPNMMQGGMMGMQQQPNMMGMQGMQQPNMMHNQVSAKRESLLAGFFGKTQPRAERFGRGGCDSRDASDELGRSGRWLRNFVAFQMARSNGQGAGTCLGPVMISRKEDEDEGRAAFQWAGLATNAPSA